MLLKAKKFSGTIFHYFEHTDLLNRMERVVKSLEELNVKITVACDSGYEDIEGFEYLDSKSGY